MSTLARIRDESPFDRGAWDRAARICRARRYLAGLLESPFPEDRELAIRAAAGHLDQRESETTK